MARFSRRTTTLTLYDGAGNTWVLGPTPMDISVPNLAENHAEVLEARDRHEHDGLFYGDDFTHEWSITAELPNAALTTGAADTILDWLHKTGKCAAYTSMDSTVWAFGALITMSDGGVTSTIDLTKNRGIGTLAVVKEGNTVSMSAICYTAPVIL